MKTNIELVEEFHRVFNHEIAPVPTIPDAATVDFRCNFIEEELQELREAVANNDIVNLADALGDIQYVLDGFFLNCGMHNKKEAIMEAIHKSNMSKACISEAQALNTIQSLKNRNVEAYFEKVGDLFIVKRTSDGKVMKSIGYAAPKLVSLFY